MKERERTPPEEALARLTSLRQCRGSRDGLLRQFLEDLEDDARVEGASVLVRVEGTRVLHYRLEDRTLHRDEIEPAPGRPFGDGDVFTGGIPAGIELRGDQFCSLPVAEGGRLYGGLFVGLAEGVRDFALYPYLKGLAGFLGVALDNIALLDEARLESRIDPLTEIFNYRYAMEEFQREIDRARRFESPFSIVLIDLDRFKSYNDRFGHLSGNDALRKIAQLLRRSIRSVDTAAKYGGDEFLLILPGTEREGAKRVAERLLEALGKADLGGGFRLSASMGIAMYPENGDGVRDLVESADKALYRAKRRGGSAVAA